VREAAGLEDIRFHDVRRTAGSYMAQAGVPLQVIGEVLGHQHPAITKVYARLASENEREAVEALGDTLGGLLGLEEEVGT
jgi:integrase